jgi:enoyl-CoA hydratase/carnithine racemase
MNWLLARLIGPGRARSAAFGGPVSAGDALRLGLVDRLVDAASGSLNGIGPQSVSPVTLIRGFAQSAAGEIVGFRNAVRCGHKRAAHRKPLLHG